MKIKRIFAIIMVICLMGALGGCRLAQPDGDTQESADRLIGMLITENDNSSSGDGDGRVYARQAREEYENDEGGTVSFGTYVFDDVDGWYIMCPTVDDGDEPYLVTCGSEGICDRQMELNSSDNGESIKVTGTLMVASGSGENSRYFIGNPVYQSSDGSVYAIMDATAMHFSDGSGMSGSMSLSENETTRSVTQSTERSSEVTVHIRFVEPTEKVRVYEMDENGVCLAKSDYTAQTMPDEYSPGSGTEFIVVQAFSGAGGSSCSAYGRSDESIVSYFAAGDVCTEFSTEINWK